MQEEIDRLNYVFTEAQTFHEISYCFIYIYIYTYMLWSIRRISYVLINGWTREIQTHRRKDDDYFLRRVKRAKCNLKRKTAIFN